jgi:hypothetical protein
VGLPRVFFEAAFGLRVVGFIPHQGVLTTPLLLKNKIKARTPPKPIKILLGQKPKENLLRRANSHPETFFPHEKV